MVQSGTQWGIVGSWATRAQPAEGPTGTRQDHQRKKGADKVFTGWSKHTLDAKGRLAIPARFRDVMKPRGDDRLVITCSDRCLVAYPLEQWRAMADKVSRLSQVDPRVQAFRRIFISGGEECACDKQGRVLIPQMLRKMAGLDNQVVLVGMQTNFEIWDEERWYQYQQSVRAEFGDLSSFMAELGI